MYYKSITNAAIKQMGESGRGVYSKLDEKSNPCIFCNWQCWHFRRQLRWKKLIFAASLKYSSIQKLKQIFIPKEIIDFFLLIKLSYLDFFDKFWMWYLIVKGWYTLHICIYIIVNLLHLKLPWYWKSISM